MKTLIAFFIVLLGCSHTNEVKNENHYSLFELDHKNFKDGRKPASVDTEAELSEDMENEDQKISEERLYFLSLLTQLRTMQSISYNSNHAIFTCPAFHTDYLNHESQHQKSGQFEQQLTKPMVNDSRLYPYLSLMNKGGEQDIKNLMASFEKIKEQTFGEVSELCERGQTDNMFVYLNLQDHLHQNKDFRFTQQAIEAMIKIPVFENIFILGTLFENERFSPYVLSSSEKEMIERMRGQVLTHYIDYVYTRRYDYKQSHMSFLGREK